MKNFLKFCLVSTVLLSLSAVAQTPNGPTVDATVSNNTTLNPSNGGDSSLWGTDFGIPTYNPAGSNTTTPNPGTANGTLPPLDAGIGTTNGASSGEEQVKIDLPKDDFFKFDENAFKNSPLGQQMNQELYGYHSVNNPISITAPRDSDIQRISGGTIQGVDIKLKDERDKGIYTVDNTPGVAPPYIPSSTPPTTTSKVTAKSGIFTKAYNTLKGTFEEARSVVYVIAGFGLTGLATAAIFGKLSLRWLAMIAIALFTLAIAEKIVDYSISGDSVTVDSALNIGSSDFRLSIPNNDFNVKY